ncbi:hypothetical protein FRB94_000487 [Tulasnella sp. JGI-2019a]|nr:hypothetical protein FRB94_000487 [Tulasnella sp. JGI-2019a]
MEEPMPPSDICILISLLSVLAVTLPMTAFLTYHNFNLRLQTWHEYLNFSHNLATIVSLVISIVATAIALSQETEVVMDPGNGDLTQEPATSELPELTDLTF